MKFIDSYCGLQPMSFNSNDTTSLCKIIGSSPNNGMCDLSVIKKKKKTVVFMLTCSWFDIFVEYALHFTVFEEVQCCKCRRSFKPFSRAKRNSTVFKSFGLSPAGWMIAATVQTKPLWIFLLWSWLIFLIFFFLCLAFVLPRNWVSIIVHVNLMKILEIVTFIFI